MSEPISTAPFPPRKMRVYLMISAAIAIFLLAAAMLYYRWATMNEPSCVLIVETSPALRGAEIEVDGLPLTAGPLTATVGQDERFDLPFYLDPGEYTVTVTLYDEVQYRGRAVLTREQPGWRIPLDHLRPTTGPSTLPAPPLF